MPDRSKPKDAHEDEARPRAQEIGTPCVLTRKRGQERAFPEARGEGLGAFHPRGATLSLAPLPNR